jgi:hypothetical protein
MDLASKLKYNKNSFLNLFLIIFNVLQHDTSVVWKKNKNENQVWKMAHFSLMCLQGQLLMHF